MIANDNLYRLTEVKEVHDLMVRHSLSAVSCSRRPGLLLFRLPYVIELIDYLTENYLHVTFADLSAEVMLRSGRAIDCCIRLGLQHPEILKNLKFESHPQNNLFLSEGAHKMYHLQTEIEAIDKLFPIFEGRGLTCLGEKLHDRALDCADLLDPIWRGMKEDYLMCIAGK